MPSYLLGVPSLELGMWSYLLGGPSSELGVWSDLLGGPSSELDKVMLGLSALVARVSEAHPGTRCA